MGVKIFVSSRNLYLVLLNVSFVVLSWGFLFITFHPKNQSSADVLFLGRSNPPLSNSTGNGSSDSCEPLRSLDGYKAKCHYLKSNRPCVSQGYVNYLYLFYCKFGESPYLGYALFILWLLVLFYLLGNTASEYFCSSLESLSKLLKLSPPIAGVTLLSLGNGAPDVFSSLVSFMGSGTQDMGLNTVLGGAAFVSCVVVGTISFLVRGRNFQINKPAFVRDVLFFLLVLVFLLVILINGEINVWGAMGFSLMYVVYVVLVYVSHYHWGSERDEREGDAISGNGCVDELSIPILDGVQEKGDIIALDDVNPEDGNRVRVEVEIEKCFRTDPPSSCDWLVFFLQLPLYLPRRLTIPVVSEERWSKPYAIASATLAPILLCALWNFQDQNMSISTGFVVYGFGIAIGIALGVVTLFTTETSNPPKKCLLPWLIGGFLMSITWSYIIAQELVGLLVSLGYIIGVSPSILGLTVLAWGNSIGDLITNSTMAIYGGQAGTQVALSGCYAGPIFNALFGMGLSLVAASWYKYPSPLVIPKDSELLETFGFLVAGLVWALMVLPRRDMRLDGLLGGGLIAVYLVSLSLRLIQTLL
ncbi:cation/calcium exchanger 2 [Punica granatum]|uniref:Sodium/calcium exchanger membrane region domain-containing protein n=2 Tax=Punica granatum TaxID=22663 RepID=A0A218WMD2_PUNGR|nr:cation/calcium exchanger 2 [Punica granatum]OWM73172.1 hypothetical protein CDL15_Pgr001286 [Punica granatum]PKI69166.1 hypothetical protein CRG98_010433 [Punica granatum]